MPRELSVKNSSTYLSYFLLALILIATTIEFGRDMFGTGDFVGYVNAGNNVLQENNIYSDYLNTWPPLFSIFSVPLALLDNFNGVVIRAFWLAGTLICLYYILRLSVQMVMQKELLLPFQLSDSIDKINFHDWRVLLPFLFVFRFVLDNLANIQINIFMLGMAMVSLNQLLIGNNGKASFWLALSVSLKVFTIFLIPYFLVRRKFKMVGLTFCWMILFNSIPFLVFGFEQASNYYAQFFHDRAEPFAMILHKNQSLFAMFRSIFVHESRGLDIYINISNLTLSSAKYLSYAIAATLVGFVLWKLNTVYLKSKDIFISETFLVLSALPIFSPLAWKAYFIFLWPSCFWVCQALMNLRRNEKDYPGVFTILMIFFVLTTTFTTEGIIGEYLSDLSEVFAAITLGTLSLLSVHLILHLQIFRKHE